MLKFLIAAAVVVVSAAGTGQARDIENRVQIHVPVSASDFSSPQRQARLAQRVDRMIRNACHAQWNGNRGIVAAQSEWACRDTMHRDANPKLLALQAGGTRLAAR